jgi:hypothetical protein
MVSARYIRILFGLGILVLHINTAHAAHVSNALSINEMSTAQSEQVVANAAAARQSKATWCASNNDYFVKVNGGREVHVHTDKTAQAIGQLKQGDGIEAEIDAQNHALLIRSFPE